MSSYRSITLVDGTVTRVRRGEMIRVRNGGQQIWVVRGWKESWLRCAGPGGSTAHFAEYMGVVEVLGMPPRAQRGGPAKPRPGGQAFSTEVFPYCR